MFLRIIILKFSIVRRKKMRRKIFGQRRKRKTDKEKEEKNWRSKIFGQQRRRKTETEKRRKYWEIENILSGEEI